MPAIRSAAARSDRTSSEFAADVRAGLGRAPKTLPSKYLYDALGSALFEAVTELPEYELTRAEERNLMQHARAIAARIPRGAAVVELGAGSGRKTVPVLEALLARQGAVSYTTIDLSAAAQERCASRISGLPGAAFHAIESGYLEGLARFNAGRPYRVPMLLLFLGSSIGNFDAAEQRAFLRDVRGLVREGDALLLGADLVQPVERMLAAYDDALGVTAAFDLNVLGRINRELAGDFDLTAFRHEARWSQAERRVEMHLRSLRSQSVRVPGADLHATFVEGETIWTESSHKFTTEDLGALAASSGFVESDSWVSLDWRFADALWFARSAAARRSENGAPR